MAVITVQAAGTTTPDDWTLSAGASKQAAVNQPDDDATSYVDSTNTVNTQQKWTFSPAITTGDAISQVKLYVRYKRGAASDATFTLTYAFTPNGGGSQTGTSGAFTSTSAWQDGSYTDSGLSVAWGSAFTVTATNTQARRVQITTLYAEITYTVAPQTLTGATIASTVAVNAPSMVTKKLAGVAIASTTALLAPAKVSFRLTAPTITATTTLYPPSSVTIAGAVTTLTGAHIAATTTLHAPSKVSFVLTGAAIAATTALSSGMVHRGLIRIETPYVYSAPDVSSVTFDLSIPAGNGRAAFVWVALQDSANIAVRLNGAAMSLLSGDTEHGLYWYESPAAGTNEVSVVCPGASHIAAAAVGVSGAQTNLVVSGDTSYQKNNGDTRTSTVVTVNETFNTNALALALGFLFGTTGGLAAVSGAAALGLDAGLQSILLSARPIPTGGAASFDIGIAHDEIDFEGAASAIVINEARPFLIPPAWSTTTTLTAPARVALPGQTLDSATIASGAALYAPTVSKIMAGATIASTAAVYTPSMITKRLAGATIAATALNAPTVVVGTRTLAGATIAATVIYAPTVVPGGVTLAGATVAITPTVYTPVAMVVGGVRLTGRPIDIGTATYAPRVTATYALAGAAIASTATLYAATVIPPTPPDPQTLTITAAITITPTVSTPVAMVPGGVRLTGRPLDVTTLVYAGVVVNRRVVEPPLIASTVQVYAPAASVRYYLIAPFIGCETPMGVNSPQMINLMTLYAMTMLALRIYGATIASGAATHAPAAVTTGPRVQTGDVFPPIEVDTV